MWGDALRRAVNKEFYIKNQNRLRAVFAFSRFCYGLCKNFRAVYILRRDIPLRNPKVNKLL